jgi:hypothetical protein
VPFSPGNVAAPILFSIFRDSILFEKRFKHLKALLGHYQVDFKSLSRASHLKAPIIDSTSGNIFDEFISVHP